MNNHPPKEIGKTCWAGLLVLALVGSLIGFGAFSAVKAYADSPPLHFTYFGHLDNNGQYIQATSYANVTGGTMRLQVCMRSRKPSSPPRWTLVSCTWTPWFPGLIPRSMEGGPATICFRKQRLVQIKVYGEARGPASRGEVIPGTVEWSPEINGKCGVVGSGNAT